MKLEDFVKTSLIGPGRELTEKDFVDYLEVAQREKNKRRYVVLSPRFEEVLREVRRLRCRRQRRRKRGR